MIPRKRINRAKVQVIPKEKIPIEHIKGSELFEDPYANIFICAKKNSGKTTTLAYILKKCANSNTTIIFFCGQIYKDPAYDYIIDWLKSKNIPYVKNNSIYNEEGQNQLKDLMNDLKNQYKKDSDSKDKEQAEDIYQQDQESDDEPPNSEIKASKHRKLAPDMILVFDDLSHEIRSCPDISSLLKENRWYKSKVIVCSQYLCDLKPEVIANLDYMLMFRKIPIKKVEEAYNKLNLDIQLPLFKLIYTEATAEPYNFLYIDVKKDQFRKNFNELFDLPE
jgi:hypothetical protein